MPETLEFSPTLLAAAELRWKTGDLNDALDMAERALAAARTAEASAECHLLLSAINTELERISAAESHSCATLELGLKLGAPRLIGLAQMARARLHLASGESSRARAEFEAALRELERAADPTQLAIARRELAQLEVTTDMAAPGTR
jgi:hypothetical protein